MGLLRPVDPFLKNRILALMVTPATLVMTVVLALSVVTPGVAWAQGKSKSEAKELSELVKRADNAFSSKTAARVLDMEVKTKSYTRSYKVVSWEDRRTAKDRALIKILGPAMWRGYGTLKVGAQLQLYNPKTNHVSTVAGSMLGDSWMGSHFSNDDLVRETELAEDYELSLIDKREGESPIGTKATLYRIKMVPKPKAPVAWGRIEYELFDDGTDILPLSARYFRKIGDKKASRAMTFTEFAKLGGRIVPTQITATVADKPGEYTRITYKKIKYDVKIPKSKFTQQALRK